MTSFSPSPESLRSCLLDLTQPIAKRTHAAFYLRTDGSESAAGIIAEALAQKGDSVLMRHELAYILGQMQHSSSCEILSSILADETDDTLVRHESAEALGAIGNESSLEILSKYSISDLPEIRETCLIAIDLITWKHGEGKEVKISSSYLSVDPAPPTTDKKNIAELQSELLDTSLSLFQRYRAMFALRNCNSDESALALIEGFNDESALFRHEIAYVLGQMARFVTVPGLSKVLEKESEHPMVRHEAAEALGAIGGSAAEALLQQYKLDSETVVKESCDVALDTMDYWASAGESFHTSL